MATAGLATELVNTTSGVWHGEDQMPDVAALVSFLDQHAVPGKTPGPPDLAAVHALRTRLRAVIDLRDADALRRGAAGLTTAALDAVTLVDDDRGRPQWCAVPRPDAPLADRLALLCGVGVLGALRALGPDRFRDCASPTCSGAFIDTSRPGRRRYCMPDLCGNRANVAAHRARRGAAHD